MILKSEIYINEHGIEMIREYHGVLKDGKEILAGIIEKPKMLHESKAELMEEEITQAKLDYLLMMQE